MKKYESPAIVVDLLDTADVITASTTWDTPEENPNE